MGPALVAIFLGAFALAILQAVLRRKLNPYGEAAWEALPEELRAEIERVLPGFRPGEAQITRKGDEARITGDYQGETMRVEANFDRAGALVEFEVDAPRRSRMTGLASPDDLPSAARQEIDRVLGELAASFSPGLVKRGRSGAEALFEVNGVAGRWKWEIGVSESGRLVEVEKERRRS